MVGMERPVPDDVPAGVYILYHPYPASLIPLPARPAEQTEKKRERARENQSLDWRPGRGTGGALRTVNKEPRRPPRPAPLTSCRRLRIGGPSWGLRSLLLVGTGGPEGYSPIESGEGADVDAATTPADSPVERNSTSAQPSPYP